MTQTPLGDLGIGAARTDGPKAKKPRGAGFSVGASVLARRLLCADAQVAAFLRRR